MDDTNVKQSTLQQKENGELAIIKEETSLQDLHSQYEFALREVKRLRKEFTEKRKSMKFLNTP